MLIKIGIDHGNVIMCVTDNESTNNLAADSMKYDWLGCQDHLIECVTGIAFDHPSVHEVLKKARKIASHFHASTLENDKLKAQQRVFDPECTVLKVIQDVETRWWSTYALLERLLQLRESIDVVLLNNSSIRLTSEEWDICVALSIVLHPFMELQKLFEGDKYVTVSLVPLMVTLMRQWIDRLIDGEMNWKHRVEDEGTKLRIEQMCVSMKEYFEKRWGRGADGTVYKNVQERGERRIRVGIHRKALMAAALDPRLRSPGSVGGIPESDLCKVWDALFVEAEKELEVMKASQDTEPTAPQHEQKRRRTNSSLDDGMDIFALFQVEAPTEAPRSDSSVAAQDEIERYKRMRSEPFKSDPIEFWKKQQYAFPGLSRVARKYLCIPATSASSERTFSTTGAMVCEKRNRLKTDIISTVVFLYGSWELVEEFWIKKEREERELDKQKDLVVLDE